MIIQQRIVESWGIEVVYKAVGPPGGQRIDNHHTSSVKVTTQKLVSRCCAIRGDDTTNDN